MKIRDIKDYIADLKMQWHFNRMQAQDQTLLAEIIDPLLKRPETDEIPDVEILEIIKKIAVNASQNLLSLIRNTLEFDTNLSSYVDNLLTLNKHHLLNQKNFDALIHCDSENRYLLQSLLYLLEAKNFRLTQSILDLFYALCTQDYKLPPDQMRLIASLTDIDKLLKYNDDNINHMKLRHLLLRSGIANKINLRKLFSMPNEYLWHLEKIAIELYKHNLFNLPCFEKVLQFIKTKLPKVNESHAIKCNRKLSCRTRSKLTITDPSGKVIDIYIQHDKGKQYPRGRYGKIKMGYESRHRSEASYAVKIYHVTLELGPEAIQLLKNKNRSTDEESRLATYFRLAKNQALNDARYEAKREAKYHELLGNQPRFFSCNNKFYLVTTWRPGKDLSRFSSAELVATSIERRLKCLISGLNDLAILHNQHRVHGDIKADNFILDLNRGKMHLNDFGLTHNHFSPKTRQLADAFCDGYSMSSEYCDDIYSMGYIFAYLFPEFYNMDESHQFTPKTATEFSYIGQALIALQSHMMQTSRDKRCRVEDALKFCHDLIANISTLDNQTLQTMIASTLDRKNIEVEDILRGKLTC